MTGARTAVLATVSSDSHGWNLAYLGLVLGEAGYAVDSLGPCSAVADVLDAVRARRPRLVVLSTVNGHGAIEAPAYARALRALPDGGRLVLVLGGNLSPGGALSADRRAALESAGFDAVFTDAEPDAVERFRALIAALPADGDVAETAGRGRAG